MLLFMATSTWLQNLQEAAVKICSEMFGCPSQEFLPKFKEHLNDCFSSFQEETSVNLWGSMGGGTP